MTGGGVLVVVPTYNEAPTISKTVSRLRTAVPQAHVLVVDDGSPDGTGEIADELAELDGQVFVLHRAVKDGLGAAYLAGFEWAQDRGYNVVVEMDADGSHQPEELPVLLAAVRDADLVLGSRYVPGGRLVNWPRRRELLSRWGNSYARLLLGLPLRDLTGGFRAFRADALQRIDLEGVASRGYCFQVDVARRTVRAGLTVVEEPITFVERVEGTSKMTGAIVREALWRVTVWGLSYRVGQLRSWVRGRPG